MANNNEINGHKTNTIQSGTIIKGDISAKGALRIDGEIEGNVNCDGKLVVGHEGKVTGEIVCINAELMGTITGKVMVKQLLSIKSTAVIEGEIKTNKIAIEPNAVFKGTCNMNGTE